MTEQGNEFSESAVVQVNASLIAELSQTGIRHTPENIIRIGKLPSGKIVFLEQGDARRRLKHILTKADQFAHIGIDRDEIPDVVIAAVVEGTIVGYQGRSHEHPRAIYEVTFKGEIKHIAVSVSQNGYIVGANPRTQPG